MAVTADQLMTIRLPGTGRLIEGLVEAGEVLYAGTMAFWDADGYLTPTAAAGILAGIVRSNADNSAGADGAVKAELYTECDIVLPLASVAQADVTPGLVYATDNYTCTLTASTNPFVGKLIRVAGTNLAEVRIDIQNRPDAIE